MKEERSVASLIRLPGGPPAGGPGSAFKFKFKVQAAVSAPILVL